MITDDSLTSANKLKKGFAALFNFNRLLSLRLRELVSQCLEYEKYGLRLSKQKCGTFVISLGSTPTSQWSVNLVIDRYILFHPDGLRTQNFLAWWRGPLGHSRRPRTTTTRPCVVTLICSKSSKLASRSQTKTATIHKIHLPGSSISVSVSSKAIFFSFAFTSPHLANTIHSDDMYAPESIELLQKSGIDFQRHEDFGILPNDFAELMITSGLVLTPDTKWISFHR